MKMTYAIIGLIILAGLVFYMISSKNKSSANTNKWTEQQAQDTAQLKKADPKNNPYQDLRNLAFGATMEQIPTRLTQPVLPGLLQAVGRWGKEQQVSNLHMLERCFIKIFYYKLV